MADKNVHYAISAYGLPGHVNYAYGGNQSRVHEETSRQYYGDRNGTYVSSTDHSRMSRAEPVVSRSSGQVVGYKDEYKVSQSVRVSDKESGTYTKYSVEEKYQKFSYGKQKY